MKKLLSAVILSFAMIGGAAAQVDQNQMRSDMIAPVVRVIVHVGDQTSTGSGTVIYSGQRNGHAETYILTNNHVIEDFVKAVVTKKTEKGDQIKVEQFVYNDSGILIATVSKPIKIAAFDDGVDLAVLKLVDDVNVIPATTVTKDDAVNVFDRVFAVGSGLDNPPFPTEGLISQTDTEVNAHRYLQESAPIIMGNSGGALFRFEVASGHYELIGVPTLVAQYGEGVVDQNIGWAIPASTVREFLKDQRWDLGFIVD